MTKQNIMTPFELMNPPYDRVITELQEKVKKAEGVVEAADKLINYQGPDIKREIEKRETLKEALKDYK